ncbi:MAG: radical SAM protein [Deltaproteobacteria bacterium]|nr:radical SAM protein [Deltaproteobacteria bacterium]
MPLPLIKIVQLTVTNRCQCNCVHCGVSKLRKVIKGEPTVAQINSMFRDFKLAGCLLVDLFGGEPTLRRDLFDIIILAKSYGFRVSLETNGYVIDSAYMERLCASGLDQIYLSLDDYRAEYHDKTRRKRGCFERAVHALELGARTDILMHVSIVPQTREFFTNGDMNRFMEFVLEHGAEKVRLLLPRFVGSSIREDSGPMCSGVERELFSHVSPRYKNFIYVHTPGTPLGETNVCTAKQVFCHVMSNGLVAPCPYFPLVFGNVMREPIVDIFERIHVHPLVRLGGDYCPMRNEEYIESHIRGLGLDRPFFPITVENQIDLGAPCRAGCPDCVPGSRLTPRPAHEIVRELRDVSPEYSRIEFYGGDAYLRHDLFEILDQVPPLKKITLWSTCSREPKDPAFMERLRFYPIEAVKVHLPLQFMDDIAHPNGKRRLGEALREMSSKGARKYPIHLYVPMDRMEEFHAAFSKSVYQLGVERLYTFTRELYHPLVNSVACFGRELGIVRLLWAEKRNP